MTFNAMYGSGALAGFRAACSFPVLGFPLTDDDIAEAPNGDLVRVVVTWPAGASMKIDCSPTNVHFLTLRSGSDHPTGLYTALCNALPDFFRDRGVQTFTAAPRDPEAEGLLRTRGFWDAVMRWRLAAS
jgi:hypothetical protein